MIGTLADVGLMHHRPQDFEVDLLGTRIRTSVDDPDLARRLKRLLAYAREVPAGEVLENLEIAGEPGRSDWVLRRNGRGIFQTDSRPRLEEHYFSILNELAIDNFSGLAIHAGVVAQGRHAIAFPGPSGAGKSTLVAACVAAGFEYVSDEALCIHTTAGLVPYARPLMLSETSYRLVSSAKFPSHPHAGKLALSPADLGGQVTSVTLQLAHVILADRGSPLGLEPIPPSHVVPELLERSFNRRGDPAASFDLVASAASNCRAWRLGYTDALDAAALMRRAFPFSRPVG